MSQLTDATGNDTAATSHKLIAQSREGTRPFV